jgi:hypothetical protein
MSINTIHDVEFGIELPVFEPDTSLANVGAFAQAVGWGGPRFESHEGAREEGFPGALVPGIMGMGFLTSAIHRWAPAGQVEHVDTVFRAPMLADTPAIISAVVTDIDKDEGIVELDMTVKNTKDETRVFGIAKVKLPLS